METLKIKMPAEELDVLVREATEKGMSPWELLDRFLSMPANQSIERAIERRIKNAGLPTTATLESFDWEFMGGIFQLDASRYDLCTAWRERYCTKCYGTLS